VGGSTAITANSSGIKNSELRYFPWGTTWYTIRTRPPTYQFTRQRVEDRLGLLFYNARGRHRKHPAQATERRRGLYRQIR
jgi:hypothetical protein